MTEVLDLVSEGWRTGIHPLGHEIQIPPEIPIEFVPHKDAPIFNNAEDAQLIIDHLISEMDSDNPQLTTEVVELTRQASLVSLWFFLKSIAGHSGPYSDLTDHLHRDMCNYRQRQMAPGSRGAIFISRSMYKSTITTHGANAWELIRDPNLRIGMIASKMDMSQQFMWATQRIFDDNELVAALFPEFVPKRGQKGNILTPRWNAVEMVLPNRTRNMPEASIKCMGAGGATAGNHFDLLNVDDLIGEKQLNADHVASEEMLKIGNWFNSNQDTLLVSPATSRVFLAATRYAPDDAYEQLFQDCKEMVGYWDELPYKINPEGQWSIYYRMAVERDKLIFPEKVDHKFLNRLRETNPWSYFTQYLNNPFSAQAAEFSEYSIRECELDFNDGQWNIYTFVNGEHKTVPLASCSVSIGIDPAASETKRSARTSRSAIVVCAIDSKNNHYYIDGSVGYYAPTKFFDEIFRLWDKYRYYIKTVNMEGQGGFKFAYNKLIEEVANRRKGMPVKLIRPLPDKDAKIRIFIQPLLDFGLVWATPRIRNELAEEITVFPGGFKRDVLDAMEIADRLMVRPLTDEEEEEKENYGQGWRENITSKGGY